MLQILGNCVTVARQTLTLFVGVRIPIPQPKNKEWYRKILLFIFFTFDFRDSNKALRKHSGGVFSAVGNERSEAKERQRAENPYSPANKKRTFVYQDKVRFFNDVCLTVKTKLFNKHIFCLLLKNLNFII